MLGPEEEHSHRIGQEQGGHDRPPGQSRCGEAETGSYLGRSGDGQDDQAGQHGQPGGGQHLRGDEELAGDQEAQHHAPRPGAPAPSHEQLVDGQQDEGGQREEDEVEMGGGLADHVGREPVEQPTGERGR